MPIKLIPPREGFSPYYYGRGTHFGTFVDRSTKARKRAVAAKIVRQWMQDIERGVFARPGEPTFASAALSYMQAGGERQYLTNLLTHFGDKLLREIDQAAIDGAAVALYPAASPATRNRHVYTPCSAVLRHAGTSFPLKRPKGAQGQQLTGWLSEDKAFPLLEQAFIADAEFGIYCVILLYTGLRLSEPLNASCDDVNLAGAEMICGKTKNGEPRRVFLPTTAVAALANHPRGLDRKGEPLFRFSKGFTLYSLLRTAAEKAGVTLPKREAFHIFRHTYATWMRRHAGADVDTLVGTGAWKSRGSAARYMHMVVSEESQRAALLPAPKKTG